MEVAGHSQSTKLLMDEKVADFTTITTVSTRHLQHLFPSSTRRRNILDKNTADRESLQLPTVPSRESLQLRIADTDDSPNLLSRKGKSPSPAAILRPGREVLLSGSHMINLLGA